MTFLGHQLLSLEVRTTSGVGGVQAGHTGGCFRRALCALPSILGEQVCLWVGTPYQQVNIKINNGQNGPFVIVASQSVWGLDAETGNTIWYSEDDDRTWPSIVYAPDFYGDDTVDHAMRPSLLVSRSGYRYAE